MKEKNLKTKITTYLFIFISILLPCRGHWLRLWHVPRSAAVPAVLLVSQCMCVHMYIGGRCFACQPRRRSTTAPTTLYERRCLSSLTPARAWWTNSVGVVCSSCRRTRGPLGSWHTGLLPNVTKLPRMWRPSGPCLMALLSWRRVSTA